MNTFVKLGIILGIMMTSSGCAHQHYFDKNNFKTDPKMDTVKDSLVSLIDRMACEKIGQNTCTEVTREPVSVEEASKLSPYGFASSSSYCHGSGSMQSCQTTQNYKVTTKTYPCFSKRESCYTDSQKLKNYMDSWSSDELSKRPTVECKNSLLKYIYHNILSEETKYFVYYDNELSKKCGVH